MLEAGKDFDDEIPEEESLLSIYWMKIRDKTGPLKFGHWWWCWRKSSRSLMKVLSGISADISQFKVVGYSTEGLV